MKNIYIKAAKNLVKSDSEDSSYRFACNAITNSGGSKYDVERMESYFKPKGALVVWYQDPYTHCDTFDYSTSLGNLGRSLMLLFMHEIYQDELNSSPLYNFTNAIDKNPTARNLSEYPVKTRKGRK